MKRIVLTFIVVGLLASIAGCASSTVNPVAATQPLIVNQQSLQDSFNVAQTAINIAFVTNAITAKQYIAYQADATAAQNAINAYNAAVASGSSTLSATLSVANSLLDVYVADKLASKGVKPTTVP